ncbi:MAG: hypothetical protein PUF12_11480 [Thermoflexaceae bacterium]|nr:hypothetical protein [Thermoflexaceae bacterium]
MKNAYNKDIWRSIRKGKKRFLSILIITALGVAMFTGLRAACEDLRYTADCFFDEQNLYDICIVSTLGLTEDDVEALEEVEGVEAAEGTYNQNAKTTVLDKSQGVEIKTLGEKSINEPYILSGVLPAGENEIAVTQNYLDASGKRLGDTLVFEEDVEDEEDTVFKRQEYVITAAVIDPADVNSAEGAIAFRNSKTTEYTFFVTRDAVESDVYTAVYVKLEMAAELLCYSDEYEGRVKRAVELIESQIKEQREQARFDEITGEAYEELSKARDEMNEEFAKADKEIVDARQEIDDGWEELLAGERELKENEEKAISEIADAREQIEEGFHALDGASEELEQGEEQLQEGLLQLKAAREELTRKEQETNEQLGGAISSIEIQLEENAVTVMQLESSREMLKAQLGGMWQDAAWETYVNTVTQAYVPYIRAQVMQEPVDELLAPLAEALQQAKTVYHESMGIPEDSVDGLSQLAEGLGQINASNQILSAQRDELNQKKDMAQAEFAKAWEAIAVNEKSLEEAENAIKEGWSIVDGNRYQLSKALEELEESEKSAMEKIADGKQEIEENRQKLQNAEKELADSIEEYEEEKKDALKEIQDAEEEIKDIDMTEWYVQDRGSLNGYANIKSDADCIESVGTAFPIVFLIVAILISLTTITRMVEEERGLIGTYKALGFGDGEILRKYLVYALLASLLGGILGDFCGFVVLPEIIFVIFHVMYIFPQFLLQFDMLYGISGILIFTVGIVGATYLSCRVEMVQMPAVLMRPKAPRSGSRVFLEYITPVWKRLSFLNKVTVRNLFRYKKRLFMTVLGIMGCTALLICGFTVKDSVTELLPSQFSVTYQYDMMAVASTADNDLLLSYMEDDNIKDYINLGVESVKLKNGLGDEESVQLYVVPEGESIESYIHLESTDNETVILGERDVFITENAGMVLDFQEGDTVYIQDLNLNQAEVTVTKFVKNYMGNNIFISQKFYEELFGGYEANGVLAHLSENCTDQIAFVNDFAMKKGILSTNSIAENMEQFSVSVALINLVVYIIIIMAAGLAFTVLFTLSTTNISERERELATIKVLGFYDKEVHSYVNKETLILTGAGILLGLPLGTVLGSMLTEALKMPSIYFAVTIYPESYVFSAVLTFVFALMVDFMTNHILDVINPVEALKSVE